MLSFINPRTLVYSMNQRKREQLVSELRDIMIELDLDLVKNNDGHLILKRNKSYSINYHA